MTMKFAIQNLLSWRDWQSHAEVYANSLEECRLADELGFHAVWRGRRSERASAPRW